MSKNQLKSIIVFQAKLLGRFKLDSLLKQTYSIPEYWEKRMLKTGWKIIITDNIPIELGGNIHRIVIDENSKNIYANVDGRCGCSNIIYRAVACFVDYEYVNSESNESVMNQILNQNTIRFIKKHNSGLVSNSLIFTELFRFVLETKGNNPEIKIDEQYQYMKKWVDGSIFERHIIVPNYIITSREVTDRQIKDLEEALEKIPKKLRNKFYGNGWKYVLKPSYIKYKNVIGEIVWSNKYIFIASGQKGFKENVWIMFAQYLYKNNQRINRKRTFKNIIESEREYIDILNKYEFNVSNSFDYFSLLFIIYLNEKNKLKEYAPESYKYIEKIVCK